MGTLLVVAGWLELESVEAYAKWRAKKVASAKLSGWCEPVATPPVGSAFDRWRIEELFTRAREAPEPIELVETDRGVRFAAALASVTGSELWASALLTVVVTTRGVVDVDG